MHDSKQHPRCRRNIIAVLFIVVREGKERCSGGVCCAYGGGLGWRREGDEGWRREGDEGVDGGWMGGGGMGGGG